MDLAALGRCLADPTRLRILDLLSVGRPQCCVSPDGVEGICVCDIVEHLGVPQSRVSYHLSRLREAGLVTETVHGWWRYYALRPQAFRDFAHELAQRYGSDQ